MLVEAIEISIKKNEALRYFSKKIPIVSKVSQFNKRIKEVNLEYIEFKVLSYEIVSKTKGNNCFRNKMDKQNITMLVNTSNGYSESIDKLPSTGKRYIAKSCIRKSKTREEDVVESVKNQIIYFLSRNSKFRNLEKIDIQEINIKEVKTIYKPYWKVDFSGKSLLIDA